MNELKLKILTPQDGIFFTGMVETVNVKTITGSLGIYYLHTPVIANLKISPLMYRFQGKEYWHFISGGLLISNGKKVTIITDEISKEMKHE